MKGQTRDPIRLERNISKTVGFRDSVPKDDNRKWHMRYQMVTWQWRHMTPKGAVRQYGQLS